MARPWLTPRAFFLRSTVVGAALVLAASAGSAQRVTVTRSGLARRLPVEIGTNVATLTAAGSDSLSVGASITVDRSRFLAFRTGEAGAAQIGMLEGPVLAAFPTRPGLTPADSTSTPADTAAETMAVPGNGEYVVLPWRFMTADAVGRDLWSLRPVFQLASPLRRDDDANVFRGSFYLAMEDTASRATSKALVVPIRLRVTTDADSLTPAMLEFTRTNFPLHEVRISASRASDSVRVRIIPEFDLRGVDMWLPVEPGIVIESTGRTVQGLGIESAPVSISIQGARLREPITIGLLTDRGTFEEEEIIIGENGVGTARIRSAGLGEAHIRAFAPGLGEDTVTYRFTWPIAFVLAALLGGVVGGLLAGLIKSRDSKTEGRRALLRGLLAGLVAAVSYFVLGITLVWLDVEIAFLNEAAVFGIAALGGLYGLKGAETGQKAAAA